MSAEPTVAVRGTGPLATAVITALRPDHHVLTAEHPAGDPSVVVTIGDATPVTGVPWLPVRVEDGHIEVGPAVRTGRPGCPTCARTRMARNRSDGDGRAAIAEKFGAGTPRLTQLTTTAGAAVVRDQIAAVLEEREQPQVIRLSVDTARTSTHALLPYPFCPDCANLPENSAEAARIPSRAVPKSDPDRFRVRDLVAIWPEVERTYVDTETGVVRSLGTMTEGICASVTAVLEPATNHTNSYGFGRQLDFASAKVSALAEALERLGGQRPRGARTVVRAAYQDIADHAIDPYTLGTYPDDRYGLDGFRCSRYAPDQELAWVWAHSYARGEPVLVPETVAYYGLNRWNEQFVYETSNGCALGGCLEEAALHGLLEIAERDAFLIAWYARQAGARVDLDSVADRRIPLLADRALREFGYEVMAFDITTEHGVPAYWFLGIDRSPTDDRPYVMCGAGAHLLPERALLNGMLEFITIARSIIARYDRDQAAAMLANGDLVKAMEDHSLLYGHPDAFPRLSFLPVDGPAQPVPERTWPRYDNLGADLAELVGRYLATGLDVLVVDQTSDEHRAAGLACAKVIVPGTVPMTFGHGYRRSDGLSRILTAPRLRGYADLDPADVNPDPHPFP